jgi:hypothetical protein
MAGPTEYLLARNGTSACGYDARRYLNVSARHG